MEKQLATIPSVCSGWLCQRKAHQRGHVVREAFVRGETDRVPARIFNILDAERVNVARTQNFIVLGTLLAVREVCEMLRASAFCERLLNCLENLSIGWHR